MLRRTTLMLPELEQLIQLQQLENSAAAARDKIDSLPAKLETLESRVLEHEDTVKEAADQLEEHRVSRAALEKDVAEIQGRLDRYKEQLMAVKTNKEYHAMQSEIAGGEEEVRRLEDQLLEHMLEADELGQEVKRAEQELAKVRATADAERKAIEAERATLQEQLTVFDADRAKVAAQLDPQTRSLFETLARGRKGLAVVEARGGLCTCCQVRLRPQLFNDIRSNTALIQCESCQRILYFAEHRHAAG